MSLPKRFRFAIGTCALLVLTFPFGSRAQEPQSPAPVSVAPRSAPTPAPAPGPPPGSTSHSENPSAVPAQAPSGTKSIELEWEPIEKAGGYEVRLTPAQGGEPLIFPTTESKLIRDVPMGVYKVQIRSRARDVDYFSPWSGVIEVEVVAKEPEPLKPEQGAVIPGHGRKKVTVDFEWTPVEKAKRYTLRVWSQARKDKPWIFRTEGTRKSLEVPPGEVYFWQVFFTSSTGIAYQQEPLAFSFSVLGAKLITPNPQAPEKPREAKTLAWKPSPEAERYKTKLLYRHLDETEWTAVKEIAVIIPEVSLSDLKPGQYRIELIAQARRRMDSDVGAAEFVVKPTEAEVITALAGSQLQKPRDPQSR